MVDSPSLHAAAHPDSDKPEHTCCVTLFEAGSFHPPTVHADFAAKAELQFIALVQPPAERVATVCFSFGILEHAPPATA